MRLHNKIYEFLRFFIVFSKISIFSQYSEYLVSIEFIDPCSNFLNFSEKLNEACDFIDDLVLTKYKEMYVDNCLNLIKFSYEKPYLQKMIIAKILKEEYVDDIKYINDKHINMILLVNQ